MTGSDKGIFAEVKNWKGKFGSLRSFEDVVFPSGDCSYPRLQHVYIIYTRLILLLVFFIRGGCLLVRQQLKSMYMKTAELIARRNIDGLLLSSERYCRLLLVLALGNSVVEDIAVCVSAVSLLLHANRYVCGRPTQCQFCSVASRRLSCCGKKPIMEQESGMGKSSRVKANKVLTSRIQKETMPVENAKQSAEQEGEEYTVEKILDKMVKQGKVFYLIKWKGYPIQESTWEPEENCESSKDLIRKFEQVEQKKKGRKRSAESSGQFTFAKCPRAESAEAGTAEEGRVGVRLMATPPRERDIGTGNLEDGTKREESTSFIDEIVDAPEADGAQPGAEKRANQEDWDATNKLPSSPETQERSSGEARAEVLVQDMMNGKMFAKRLIRGYVPHEIEEEDAEDRITVSDRQLRVFQGVKVESVMGVSNRSGSEELKALVRYEDEKYEMVPTRVLHIVAPRVCSSTSI
uniref:Chromo domain-containing protein n=1 Tax=Ascaris lumbricoides TaxID=6252 RepID=A0A0M3I5D1_ASCLU